MSLLPISIILIVENSGYDGCLICGWFGKDHYSEVCICQPVQHCMQSAQSLFAFEYNAVVANICWFCRYDHLRKEASDIKPAKVDKIAEPWRAALESTFTDYVQNHYNKLGSVSVYGTSTAEGNITLTACIESHEYSPKNFWWAVLSYVLYLWFCWGCVDYDGQIVSFYLMPDLNV